MPRRSLHAVAPLAPALLVLAAAAPAHPSAPQAAGPTAYDVTVRACDWSGSGTDDNVWGRLRDTANRTSCSKWPCTPWNAATRA
ncbi:hypothetical protein HEK131_30460 [Streptomyces seoulensis]|nr:hypothetical protein HEK131_30460 [Streptomyces seoulensis]